MEVEAGLPASDFVLARLGKGSDLCDTPYRYSDGRELRGEDQAHHRVSPAKQRFGAHGSAVCRLAFGS
jgi:hypothetical protein